MKKGKTPIFLPSQEEIQRKKLKEYLICYHTEDIFLIEDSFVTKM